MAKDIKLSIWSSYYVDLSPEDALCEIARHGYRYTELSDEHTDALLLRGDPTEVGIAFAAHAASLGVSIPQGHLLLRAHIARDEDLTVLERQLELFCAIGIKSAVLHCDAPEGMSRDAYRARNLAGLSRLLDTIGDRDLCICLENLRLHHQGVEELLYYVKAINSPHLGICLDTGHLNISHASSQKDFILRAGKHLRALHIADNEGERDQHLMPFGRGTVDMREVYAALCEIGYDGILNLEIPGERFAPLEIRGYKLQYLERAFDHLVNVHEMNIQGEPKSNRA